MEFLLAAFHDNGVSVFRTAAPCSPQNSELLSQSEILKEKARFGPDGREETQASPSEAPPRWLSSRARRARSPEIRSRLGARLMGGAFSLGKDIKTSSLPPQLESPEWLWMRGEGFRFVDWTPPKVGETVVVRTGF